MTKTGFFQSRFTCRSVCPSKSRCPKCARGRARKVLRGGLYLKVNVISLGWLLVNRFEHRVHNVDTAFEVDLSSGFGLDRRESLVEQDFALESQGCPPRTAFAFRKLFVCGPYSLHQFRLRFCLCFELFIISKSSRVCQFKMWSVVRRSSPCSGGSSQVSRPTTCHEPK